MVSEGPKILIFSYLGVIDKALASNPLRQWRRQHTARITPEFDSALHMLPLNMLVFGKSQPLTALLDPPPGCRLAGGMRSCLFNVFQIGAGQIGRCKVGLGEYGIVQICTRQIRTSHGSPVSVDFDHLRS